MLVQRIPERENARKPEILWRLIFNKTILLRKFADWFENWKLKGDKASLLTLDTFGTAIHTSRTLPELSDYILRNKRFAYVSYQYSNSDCIEGGFGHRRVLCGGDYYASSRQFFESENAIRIKSLAKYNCYSMSDIKNIFCTSKLQNDDRIIADADMLLEKIDFPLIIIWWGGGYIKLRQRLHSSISQKAAPPP